MVTEGVHIYAGGAALEGEVTVPDGAVGCVVFAHGSGSSRRSPRNIAVAQALHEAGLATVLLDLLTSDESRQDALDETLRFDIPMLGERLTATVDDVGRRDALRALPLGLFGASTGAAAALVCAAQRPEIVRSVVSRGGRPDLAGDALGRVTSPTLLLVGGRDRQVLRLNEDAARHLAGEREVSVVPEASHLFEEPGALAQVSRRAVEWFTRTLNAVR